MTPHRAMALAVVALAAAAAPAAARAWSPEGHVAVAERAWERLSPPAREAARALLGGRTIADREVATWADRDAAEGRSPRAFHYVNVPISAPGYDPRRDCPRGECAPAKLERELELLGDPRQPPGRRAEALRWVVHLVADLHQPLHCADRGDRGGNDTRVARPGPDTNLHAVWDGLPERCALDPASRSPSSRAPPVGAGAGHPRAWVDECHAVGREVYAAVPRRRAGVRLDDGYEAGQCRIVERQLSRAAARLRRVLEAALAAR